MSRHTLIPLIIWLLGTTLPPSESNSFSRKRQPRTPRGNKRRQLRDEYYYRMFGKGSSKSEDQDDVGDRFFNGLSPTPAPSFGTFSPSDEIKLDRTKGESSGKIIDFSITAIPTEENRGDRAKGDPDAGIIDFQTTASPTISINFGPPSLAPTQIPTWTVFPQMPTWEPTLNPSGLALDSESNPDRTTTTTEDDNTQNTGMQSYNIPLERFAVEVEGDVNEDGIAMSFYLLAEMRRYYVTLFEVNLDRTIHDNNTQHYILYTSGTALFRGIGEENLATEENIRQLQETLLSDVSALQDFVNTHPVIGDIVVKNIFFDEEIDQVELPGTGVQLSNASHGGGNTAPVGLNDRDDIMLETEEASNNVTRIIMFTVGPTLLVMWIIYLYSVQRPNKTNR